jgi:hypothetical protein
MAKYRILTKEELKNFETEFVNYLVVNGIAADDWVKMKAEEPEKASKIVELFSDVIMEGVLRKVNFVEIRQKAYVQSIQFMTDAMRMAAISCKDPKIDLREIDFSKITASSVELFEIHQGEKKYDEIREQIIFDYVQKGFEVSDGKLFKSLALALIE